MSKLRYVAAAATSITLMTANSTSAQTTDSTMDAESRRQFAIHA